MQEETKSGLWAARLHKHARSDLTIKSWCASEGVTEATFHYWRKRLSTASSPPTELIALPLAGRPDEPMLELL